MTLVPDAIAPDGKYVLVTPARNEERYIGATIEAVRAQTIRPRRWVIVDDGSTDRTGDIAEEYARSNEWIEVVRRPQRQQRSFAGKAHAFNAGFERVREMDFACIGSLDADVTFEPDYFEHLLKKFQSSDRLGLVGTGMIEEGYDPLKESFFNEEDVFGACQLFRRSCFEAVGGYTPVRGGGIDWIAVRTARMKGWQTRCFLDKSFYHHRPMGATESNVLRARFEYGQKDYYLGNHPLWEIFRIAFQLTARPYVIGGLLIMTGYLSGVVTRMKRPLSPELMAFHRREQLGRLRGLITKRLRSGLGNAPSVGRAAER
jgi:biofilm PGA synthesis N-glycosyltransferase PgaC